MKKWRALAHMLVSVIDSATLFWSLLCIVFTRSYGLPPGAWAEGHYMVRLGETAKNYYLLSKAQALRKWAKDCCG